MRKELFDGIIFTGGSVPPDEVIIRLCSQASFIVCADSGWDIASRCGVLPSCLVGDFDSVQSPLPNDRRIDRFARAKDATDTELAFQAALNAGVRSVTVIGGGGGRMDHWLALWHLFCKQPLWRRWETQDESIERVSVGQTWQPSAEKNCRVVSVFALGQTATVVSEGFRWSLNGYPLGTEAFSLSNEIKKNASLKVCAGEAAVIVPRCGAFPTSD